MYTDVNHLTLLKKKTQKMNINRIKKNQEQTQFLNTQNTTTTTKPTVFQFFTNQNVNGENSFFLALVFAFLSFYYKSHKREIFVGKIFEEESLVSLFIINDLG